MGGIHIAVGAVSTASDRPERGLHMRDAASVPLDKIDVSELELWRATCHVYVDPAWIERVERVGEMEASMPDFAEGVRSNSRLACQIQIDTNLGGIVFRLPAAQH